MKVVVDCVGVRDGGGARLLTLLMAQLCVCRPEWEWFFCTVQRVARDFDLPVVPRNAEVIEVNTTNSWCGRYLWLNLQLPKLIARRGGDLLFSFANLSPAHSPVPTVLFIQQMKALAIPRELSWQESLRLHLLRRYMVATADAAQRIVVQSEQMRALVRECVPRMTSRVDVIQSPVEIRCGSPINSVTTLALDKATRPWLAYISLPRKHKNHLNLLRAFAIVRNEIPKASLLMTIPAPTKETSDSVVASIHETVHSLGISESIVWLGILKPEEVVDVYTMVDMTVFPSLQESFGMPLAEALCAGKPTVASDLPFSHEILSDAGAYFDPEQPRDIARVILETLRTPGRLREMTAAAESRKSLFSSKQVAERMCTLFEDVILESRLA